MILYTTTITNRLTYIADFIGKEIAGEAILLTNSIDEFQNYDGVRINYCDEKMGEESFWIKPHSLLFEEGIKQQSIHCFETNGYKAFFKTSGNLPFDVFAAAFYFLSRYEEYLPHEKDMYGRYAHENSLAYRENFLQLPLINTWLRDLEKILKEKFPAFTTHRSPSTFLPTYDIDEAYSYKHKGWFRTVGAGLKELVKGKFNKLGLRLNVLNNKAADPFDSYEWLDALHQKYSIEPRYFFLVPEKIGTFDRNILPSEKALQQLIKQHADKYEVGVHPSWQSGDAPALVNKEKQTIENIAGKKIKSSRQHFIRFTLPQTFRHLIDAGIQEDFSMGYGSINGFRASVASPFFWYDLEKEEATSLLLYPFCYMEANSFFEQKFSPQQAAVEMRQYYNEVKKVNGTFISIWHNTFLGTDEMYKGWREVYKEFVDEVFK